MLLVNCACTHTLNFALNSLETESLMVKMDSKTSLPFSSIYVPWFSEVCNMPSQSCSKDYAYTILNSAHAHA